MSIKAMSWVWESGPSDQASLLVLLALADFANGDAECWPAMALIALRARMSERNARRIIRRLEDEGWIETVASAGRKSSTYRILIDRPNPDTAMSGLNGQICAPNQDTVTGFNPDKLSVLKIPTRTPRVSNPDTAVSAKPLEPSLGGGDCAQARETEETETQTLREKILEAIGLDYSGLTGRGGQMVGTRADMVEVDRWMKSGLDEEAILDVVREVVAKSGTTPSTLRYFTPAMERLVSAMAQGPIKPNYSTSQQTEQRNGPAKRNSLLAAADAVARRYALDPAPSVDQPPNGGAAIALFPARR